MSDKFEIIIPEVNTESGIALCGANVKIYLMSLRLFVENVPVTLKKMQDLIPQNTSLHHNNETKNNLRDYLTSVHSIKGMCVYIGAEDAGKNAKQLEYMAEAGDLKSILEKNNIFISQIERIISNIQAWLGNNGSLTDEIDAG